MDEYAKSLQDVDAALNRLNATLASYKPYAKPVENNVRRQTASAPADSRVNNEAQRQQSLTSDKHGIRKQPRLVPEGTWKDVCELRSHTGSEYCFDPDENAKDQFQPLLSEVSKISNLIAENPYCIPLYILLGQRYLRLGHPDLACGAAYKALLLSDAVQDVADEYHEDACDAVRKVIQQQPLVERISLLKGELHADLDARQGRFGEPDEETDVEVDVWLREHYLLLIYRTLVHSLVLCDCLRTAWEYNQKGRKLYPRDKYMADVEQRWISYYVGYRLRLFQKAENEGRSYSGDDAGRKRLLADEGYGHPLTWPDSGMVRRERYSWNSFEPDRINELPALNAMMAEVAPKLEVRAVELPALSEGWTPLRGRPTVSVQLGVFAKEDLAPGDMILDETSILTANNKLQDALCDACSADLPELGGEGADNTSVCPDCDVVFCGEECLDQAMESYHPALCGMDVEAIARDVPPAEAADSLYALLLLRSLAMAETQECHPLELKEIKYIWGDFHGLPLEKHWRPAFISMFGRQLPDVHSGLPATLPFSFEHNVRLPFHMLEKMDIDIFANPQYDVWVFNTLYAKFRGTASARLSGLGGRPVRGPEVSAVHPMWCLANHHCDPNVTWDWAASIKFKVLDSKVEWAPREGVTEGEYSVPVKKEPGIKKGEEVLNHYCDIRLPVKERREWLTGALGGKCMCGRCVFENDDEADTRAVREAKEKEEREWGEQIKRENEEINRQARERTEQRKILPIKKQGSGKQGNAASKV